jgi:hypothetical protein
MLKNRSATVIKAPTNELDTLRLLEWTLPPSITKPRLAIDGCRPSLEAILDVQHANKENRNKMVELAAQSLSQVLNDARSIGWYQKLLWQLLRRSDATGEDYSYQVYLIAQRARTDTLEGFARRPGALFVSRLKGAPWFEAVMNSPPNRVGIKPN